VAPDRGFPIDESLAADMNFVEASADDLRSGVFRELLSCSPYRAGGTSSVFFQRALSGQTRTYLALDGANLLGQVTVSTGPESGQGSGLMIESVSVRTDCRRQGVGRFLLHGLLTHLQAWVLRAETGDDAVGFFHRCGFCIRPLTEVSQSTVRYKCHYDDTAWVALPYRAAIDSLLRYGVRAWVAGGWALDLFHGRQTRLHVDTDILICRADQDLLFAAFPGWEIYRTHAPGLALWTRGDYLRTTPNVWLRRDSAAPWSLEVMFLDTAGDQWIYKRNPAIRGPVEQMGLVTPDGIPYLCPEIQLLYKGGSSRLREKDTQDLLNALPLLPAAARRWLKQALLTQFPQGHAWLSYLDGRQADR
jgi:GNAT superfamily N-acetyltransferase